MSKGTYKISNANNRKNSLTRQTANNMQVDYKVYLDEFSLERKLKDVLQESVPGYNMLGGKLVKIIVTVEYEQ